MTDWAEVRKHEEDNLTLLCDSHNRQKQSKLLTEEQVRAANLKPWCTENGVTAPFGLNFTPSDVAEIHIGSNTFRSTADLYPIVVDDGPIFGFHRSDEGLMFGAALFDEFNRPILRIHNNEIEFLSDLWDVSFAGRTLTIRQALRNIFLVLDFEPPSAVRVARGRILVNGVEIVIDGTNVAVGKESIHMSGNSWASTVGFTVGWCPSLPAPHPMLALQVDRYI